MFWCVLDCFGEHYNIFYVVAGVFLWPRPKPPTPPPPPPPAPVEAPAIIARPIDAARNSDDDEDCSSVEDDTNSKRKKKKKNQPNSNGFTQLANFFRSNSNKNKPAEDNLTPTEASVVATTSATTATADAETEPALINHVNNTSGDTSIQSSESILSLTSKSEHSHKHIGDKDSSGLYIVPNHFVNGLAAGKKLIS